MPSICETWTDHDWSDPRALDQGRHPVLGAFIRVVSTCTNCGKRSIETRFDRQQWPVTVPNTADSLIERRDQ